MVVAQPYLRLTQNEPYQWTDESRSPQLAAIETTLQLARSAPHGAPKTHFTLFPEYSIPGIEGVQLVDKTLRAPDWPVSTIVIGGTDGLTKEAFLQLANEPNTHVDERHNDPSTIEASEWINCGITWTKGKNRTVERWLQPKLHPAWPEQNISCHSMFCGNSVFVFKGCLDNGTQYRFCSLVCFDWIAMVNGQRPWRAVTAALSSQARELGAELPLSWCFVIQHNRKPSAPSFLTEINAFFDQTIEEPVRRDRTCLVFVNSAGKPRPGRVTHNGSTSVLFSGQSQFKQAKCPPTFCYGSPRFSNRRVLDGPIDHVFREGGACIHSFRQVNPGSIRPGAADKKISLLKPFVYSFSDSTDPRTPGYLVPASVKWLNDELDETSGLSDHYQGSPLATAVDSVHRKVVNKLRIIPGHCIDRSVELAVEGYETPRYADQWGDTERVAVQHLIHTLNVLGLSSDNCIVDEGSVHATLTIGDRRIDVVAIRGATHEGCIQHYKKILPTGRNPVLLVSRDPDNNPRDFRFRSFVTPTNTQQDWERRITDPSEPNCHLSYRDLLDIFLTSDTVFKTKEQLNAKLFSFATKIY